MSKIKAIISHVKAPLKRHSADLKHGANGDASSKQSVVSSERESRKQVKQAEKENKELDKKEKEHRHQIELKQKAERFEREHQADPAKDLYGYISHHGKEIFPRKSSLSLPVALPSSAHPSSLSR
jgi:predicted RNase H-like nuclease (RuvC/YqgF family)